MSGDRIITSWNINDFVNLPQTNTPLLLFYFFEQRLGITENSVSHWEMRDLFDQIL